jgi:hypothetical protein
MVYCTKCGAENPENSATCSKCGASMNPPPYRENRNYRRGWDDDACFGRSYMGGVIIGLFILILGVSQLIGDTYAWASFDKLWPWLLIVMAIAIIANAIQRR